MNENQVIAARFYVEGALHNIATITGKSISAAGTAYSPQHAQRFLKSDLPFLLDQGGLPFLSDHARSIPQDQIDGAAMAEGVMQALITLPGDISGLPHAKGIRTRQRDGQETDATFAYEILKVIAERKLRALTPERFSIYMDVQLAQLPNYSDRIGDIVELNPDLAGIAADRIVAELGKTDRHSNSYTPLRKLLARLAAADATVIATTSISAITVKKAESILGDDVAEILLAPNSRLEIHASFNLLKRMKKRAAADIHCQAG